MEYNKDNVVVNIDGASFKKLAVAAYAVADKKGDPLYQYVLLTNNGGYIYAYGTDKYQAYRTRIKCVAGKIEAPEDFRLLLLGDDLIAAAKHVKPDMNVCILYTRDKLRAKIVTYYTQGNVDIEEGAYSASVFFESEKSFQNSNLEKIFLAPLESEPCFLKTFNLIFFEKLAKSIKTGVSSASERKNLSVEISRSGRNMAEVFTYKNWFDAALMPISAGYKSE